MPNLLHGDCIEEMRKLPENSVDAIVTDPPYGLGFMGKKWDDLPPGLEFAEQALRVLKPGGHLLAFGGTRTYHRLACAIEDAGFEIRDCLAWLYGSGFPKSLDVSKAIDKAAGAEREVVGRNPNVMGRQFGAAGMNTDSTGIKDGRQTPGRVLSVDETAPATPEAAEWQGWGTALKPANEPVIMARKPFSDADWLATIGSHLDRLEAWLAQAADPITPTGAAEGSSARTDTSPSESAVTTFWNTVTSWRNCWAELSTAASTSTTSTAISQTTALKTLSSSLSGITPESTTLDLSPTSGLTLSASVVDSLFAAAVLNSRATLALSADETATASTPTSSPVEEGLRPNHEPIVLARKPLTGTVAANVLEHGTGALNVDGCRVGSEPAFVDRPGQRASGGLLNKVSGTTITSGGAGRWPANVILDPEAGAMLDEQSGELHSQATNNSPRSQRKGVTDFVGGKRERVYYGKETGGASRFFYCAKASKRERNAGLEGFEERETRGNYGDGIQDARPHTREGYEYRATTKNVHPTVKPIALMRWLVRLVTPPNGTVLDPFLGSGTTGIAAKLEGFDFIGIERESEYLAIARARIDHHEPEPESAQMELAA